MRIRGEREVHQYNVWNDPLIKSILRLCKRPVYNITYLHKILQRKASYWQIYRRVQFLQSKGYIKHENGAYRLTRKGFDLLVQLEKTGSNTDIDLISTNAKLHKVQNIDNKYHDKYHHTFTDLRKATVISNVLTKKQMLDYPAKNYISQAFYDYIEDVRDRKIVLKAADKEIHELEEDDILILDYETRFTSLKRAFDIIDKFDEIFKIARANYKYAVHLVLTTDPNRFSNIYEANKHFTEAWRRFTIYLKRHIAKRLGIREKDVKLPYVAVYEFMQNGLLHVHAVFFGYKFIMPKEEITKVWEEKCNHGKVNYVYALKRTKKGYVYYRKRPKDLKKGQTCEMYLSKYLHKNMNLLFKIDDIREELSIATTKSYIEQLRQQLNDLMLKLSRIALYWVFNKRFFSYSYKYFKIATYESRSSGDWEFWFSCHENELLDYLEIIESETIEIGTIYSTSSIDNILWRRDYAQDTFDRICRY